MSRTRGRWRVGAALAGLLVALALVASSTVPAAGSHGGAWHTVARASLSSAGAQGNGGAYNPSFSADGRSVAFGSTVSNLVEGNTNGTGDIFVAVREATPATVPVTFSTTLQGRPPAPHPSWVTRFTVDLYEPGTVPSVSLPMESHDATSDEDGKFSLDVTPGVYDVRAKGAHTLRVLVPNVDLASGPAEPIDLGVQVEGDYNGDNIVDVSDYSALLAAFGILAASLPAELRTLDFNQDGVVDVHDYSILLFNFGRFGAPPEFNGVPLFNLAIEPAINPPCGQCRNEPAYASGINQVLSGRVLAGEYPGEGQDSGDGTGLKTYVFLHSGELSTSFVALEIPGRGFSWRLEGRYRSGVTLESSLGRNWDLNYNRRLLVVRESNLDQVRRTFASAQGGDVVRLDGSGRADLYSRGGDGSYRAPRGFYTELTLTPDGGYIEKDAWGNLAVYGRPGPFGLAAMTTLADRNGNTMQFLIDNRGRLVQVIDTLGRHIDYLYNTEGHLIEVRDFANRAVTFEYDGNGDLVAVTGPAVTGTPNNNDFPQGKTIRYAYSSGFADGRLNHNLIAVTGPNEVASGGQARLRALYDERDRVKALTLGGTNDTGVPAGGTILYQYRSLGVGPPGDLRAEVSQTTVIDRNGNQTDYRFNGAGNIIRIREFTNLAIRPTDPDWYETLFAYKAEGEIVTILYPEGNLVEYAHNSVDGDPFAPSRMLAVARTPDAAQAGDQERLTTSYRYEPLYNQVAEVIEPRGNDPSYAPQNGGAWSPERYTTTYTFDFQEGTDYTGIALRLGLNESRVRELLTLAGIPMGLGDVNGDAHTDQINGNVVRVEGPQVTLLPPCPEGHLSTVDANCSLQARSEGTSRQPIIELYRYNAVGQLIGHTDPEGNIALYTYYPENDPDGDGLSPTPGVGTGPFGYLSTEVRDSGRSPERDSGTNPDPSRITKLYLYDAVGNLVRETDGRGVATQYVVNQLNQVVEIIQAVDVSDALDHPEEPKWRDCADSSLAECRSGMSAFGFRTRIYYDFNDNVIRREAENRGSNNQALAGQWVTTELRYDILDALVEESREVSESPALSAITRYRYDRNGNQVLVISPAANLSPEHPDRQPSNVNSFVFDERDLLHTSTRGGLTPLFQALASTADVPERVVIPTSPGVSTFAQSYDRNRNLTTLRDAADTDGDGQPESTLYLYDGFDRQVSTINAVGTQTFSEFDPASQVVRVSTFGPVAGPSPTTNAAATLTQPLTLASFTQPLLSQVELKYDEAGRLFERNERLFAYQGVTYRRAPVLRDGPLGRDNDSWVTTRHEFDRRGLRTFLIEDDLTVTQTFYDGAGRAVRVIDAEGNEVLNTYDDNDNLTRRLEVEITPRDDVAAQRAPDLRETFVTFYVFDSLNRLIRVTDNLGQTRRQEYDSRHNLIRETDAQHSTDDTDLIFDPLGLFASASPQGPTRINREGNEVLHFYDGLDRNIAEVRTLRRGGQGRSPLDVSDPANPDGLVVVDQRWDANSRLVAVADDGSTPGDQNTTVGLIEDTNSLGNITRYAYDDLDRRTREVLDDGTVRAYTYDADDNLVRVVDQNGTVIRNVYDGANRLVGRDIGLATSADPHPAGGFKDGTVSWRTVGTTLQEFRYDGLSRPTLLFDNNDPSDPADDAITENAYDSRGRLLEEAQDGLAVSSRWDGDNRRLGLVYPNGREIELAYDRLDRIRTITDGGEIQPLAEYLYLGPGRVLERLSGNGVRLTYLDDSRSTAAGYDGLKRTTTLRHVRPDNSLVVGFTHQYDRANNRLSEVRLHEGDLREDYKYDSLYRLVERRRGIEAEEIWVLDGAGNWASHTGSQNRPNNMNQYEAFAGSPQLYDDNGNLVEDQVHRYEYDFANRLRRVVRRADDTPIAAYQYDTQDRRIERTVSSAAGFEDRVLYLYDGWQELEERRLSGARHYVYGTDIDELLVLDRDLDGDGRLEKRLYYQSDTRTNIVGVTDATGAVIERYSYDAYGVPAIQDAGGRPSGASSVGNARMFTGRPYDEESGFYYYRFRQYSPPLGRFLQVDPFEAVCVTPLRSCRASPLNAPSVYPAGDTPDSLEAARPPRSPASLQSSYAYVGNRPIVGTDPYGLRFHPIPIPEGGGLCPQCKVCLYKRQAQVKIADFLEPYGISIAHWWMELKTCRGQKYVVEGMPSDLANMSGLLMVRVREESGELTGKPSLLSCSYQNCDVCDCILKKAKEFSGKREYAWCGPNCNTTLEAALRHCVKGWGWQQFLGVGGSYLYDEERRAFEMRLRQGNTAGLRKPYH